MQDDGAVLAIDIDESRLDRLRENAERLGITCIQPKALAQLISKMPGRLTGF